MDCVARGSFSPVPLRKLILPRQRKFRPAGWILKGQSFLITARRTGPTRRLLGIPTRVFVTGGISVVAAVCSASLIGGSSAIYCNSLPELTVLATLAAFLISVYIRQMGRYSDRRSRWILFFCLLIAAGTLFADFRFVRRYRGFCQELRQQLPQAKPTR